MYVNKTKLYQEYYFIKKT